MNSYLNGHLNGFYSTSVNNTPPVRSLKDIMVVRHPYYTKQLFIVRKGQEYNSCFVFLPITDHNGEPIDGGVLYHSEVWSFINGHNLHGFPFDITNCIVSENMDVKHTLLLKETLRHNNIKLNLKTWVIEKNWGIDS